MAVDYYVLEEGIAGGASLDWQPFIPLGPSGVRLIPAIGFRVDVMDIPIGEVGRNESDGYFGGEGGDRFPAGSMVMARGASIGGEASAGLAINISRDTSIFGEVGYRLLRGVGEWAFRVERGGQQLKLLAPSVPFTAKDFTAKGPFLRIGLSF